MLGLLLSPKITVSIARCWRLVIKLSNVNETPLIHFGTSLLLIAREKKALLPIKDSTEFVELEVKVSIVNINGKEAFAAFNITIRQPTF